MMEFPEHFGATPSTIFHHGNIGVAIFFVISGFIIFIVTFNADLSTKVTLKEFAIKRLLRIVPFLDLSPKNSTMNLMRFPDNVTQWRFQHEEEALFRRADHQGNQAA
jgi:hypothetical protein